MTIAFKDLGMTLLLCGVVAGCSSQVSVAPRTANDVERPSIRNPLWPCGSDGQENDLENGLWDLGRLDRESYTFYKGAAQNTGLSFEDILAPLAEDYRKRAYSFEEFLGVLRTLRSLVEKKPLMEVKAADEEPRLGTGTEPIVLYVDPTCSSCRKVLNILLEGQRACGTDFPPVVFRILPSKEESAVYAAAALEHIRRTQPEDFVVAVLEFTQILPDDHGLINELLAERGIQEQAVEEVHVHASELKVEDPVAPLVVYKGRVLRREKGKNEDLPFDPLRNWEILLATLKLVDIVEGAYSDACATGFAD